MTTIEHSGQSEPQSNNGWQNQGIYYKFVRDNVPAKLRVVLLEISDKSFGRKRHFTPRLSHRQWANEIGISEKTFYSHVHELLELNMITVNTSHNYIQDGGSEAFSYSPTFPNGYGQLRFDDEQPASGSNEPNRIIYDPSAPI